MIRIAAYLYVFSSVSLSEWEEMELVLNTTMPVVYEVDVVTGLAIFMLATVGSLNDMELAYHLLKESPCIGVAIHELLY